MKPQIWNKSWWISETREKKLDEMFGKMLIDSGFKILDEMEHEFSPYGYTKLYLLAESHFAVHTFPEANKTYIELSSCNEEYYNEFVDKINKEVIHNV